MIYDITERLGQAWAYYDKLLDEKLEHISEISGVSIEKMVKINPAEFIERNKYQKADGYEYKRIGEWLRQTKTDENYLISPFDDDIKTSAQIAYKEKLNTTRIRASKCDVIPISNSIARSFYVRNHRQSLPKLSDKAINYALAYKSRIVGAMTYDLTTSAVRGKSRSDKYELLRLAFARGFSIAGGASRLQKHCEQSLERYGQTTIFSYSNATINNGKVYEALGFVGKRIDGGQPFVIMENNTLVRLVNLHPYSTDKSLAVNGRIKTHLGGNKLWEKQL